MASSASTPLLKRKRADEATAAKTEPVQLGGGTVPGEEGGRPEDECFSMLVVASSGSGKTTLVRTLLASEPLSRKPVYVHCNNKTFDAGGASSYAAASFPRAKPITLEEAVRTVHDAVIVIEDVQTLSNLELELVKQLINWGRRHCRLHVFVIAHIVYRSGLPNILSIFDAIAVLQNGKSKESFDALVAELNVERHQAARCWSELVAARPFSLALFTAFGERTVQVVESPTPPNLMTLRYLLRGSDCTGTTGDGRGVRKRRLKEESIEHMLRSFKDQHSARAIFNMVRDNGVNLPFDYGDYSVLLRNSKGSVLPCSLFDYVSTCLGETSEPTRAVKAFHKALGKHFVIPSSFVKNRKMRK